MYFQLLFEEDFTRRSEDPINRRLLNYGYAIMRGIVSRSLANYGFSMCLGIYHDNQLNPFNLADDVMEVFRPVVDQYVAQKKEYMWSSEVRAELVNLLNSDVEIRGARHSVTAAVEEMVKSFMGACREQDFHYFKLPFLLPYRVHQYE